MESEAQDAYESVIWFLLVARKTVHAVAYVNVAMTPVMKKEQNPKTAICAAQSK